MTRLRPRLWWLLVPVLGLGLLFRLHLVGECNIAPPDGRQYHSLSQELQLHGRFAFGPPPAPLTYSRLPGYPLFLAYVAVRRAPIDLNEFTRLATQANAVLDVLTALLVAAILRELGAGPYAALLGTCITLLCPLMFTLASQALTESLSTLLCTLIVYLCLRLWRNGSPWVAVTLGLCSGAAQLIRADAICLWPGILVAVLLSPCEGRPRRFALLLLCAALVFAPWPLRNLHQFGKPYFTSWQWRNAVSGDPLPTGVLSWARTFATGDRSEYFLDPALSFGRPIYPLPVMYDSPLERAGVAALLARYNAEGLSPVVDAGFSDLARERARRAPLRTYALLPLARMKGLFASVPGDELVMRSPLLDLPRHRPWFRTFDRALYWLALLGALLLLWRGRRPGPKDQGERRGLIIISLMILTRCAVVSYTVPLALSQRHLVEAFPLFIVLASYGVSVVGSWLLGARS